MTDPELIIAGLNESQQQTVARVENWNLTFATVMSVSGHSLIIQIDGEGFNGTPAVSIPAISLVDSVSAGDRVVVFTVPPNGNYVIRNASAGNAPSQSSIRITPDAQSYALPAFTDVLVGGVPATFSFTKVRDDSRIAVVYNMSGFITGTAGTKMAGALNINGEDYDTSSLLFNQLVEHLSFGSSDHIPVSGDPGIPAGTYDVTLRWSRPTGVGTLQMNTDDMITCLLIEAPPA